MPLNETQHQAAAMKLAELDFRLATKAEMDAALPDLSSSHLSRLRKEPLYKETVAELQKAWRQKMLDLPGTTDLRRKISHNLTLAIQRMTEVLEAPPNKDTIAACRLTAQMDGRFMGAETSPTEDSQQDTKAVAQELLTVMGRIDTERKPS